MGRYLELILQFFAPWNLRYGNRGLARHFAYAIVVLALFLSFGISVANAAPLPPSSLTVSNLPGSQGGVLALMWVPSVSPEVLRQRVYRSTTAGGPYTLVTEISGNTTNIYTDTGLTNGTIYYYVVRSSSGVQASFTDDPLVAFQSEVKAQHFTELRQAIDSLRGQVGLGSVSWTPSTLGGIFIETVHLQQMRDRFSEAMAAQGLSPTFTDPVLTSNAVFIKKAHIDDFRKWLKVQESINSNEASAAPANSPPLAPTQLTAVDNPGDQGGAIKLSWAISTSPDVTEQRLYRATASGGPYTPLITFTGNTHTSYVDMGVSANTTYYYVIRAYNGTQESANSGEASAVSVNNRLATYVYDEAAITNGKGRLTSVTDLSGSTTFFYDVRGNLSRTDKTINGDPLTYRIDYLYDSLDRLVDLTYPDPTPANRELVRHTYNSQGLLDKISSITHNIDYVSNFDYNAVGRVTKKTLGNGLTTDYEYYPANFRLRRIKTALGANAPLQDLTYTYDNVGNVETIADAVGPADQTFTYDNLHRLITASSVEAPAYSYSYSYNSIGNMLSGAGKSFGYPLPGSPQPHAPTGDGASNYYYSPNGNLISKTTGATIRTFSWNVENRLTKIEENGNILSEFTYNDAGKRVKRWVGSNVTTYIEDLYECSPNSCSKYIFAGSERIALRPIGSSNEVFYYLSDHLGSSTLVTDNAIGIEQNLVYYPYGKTRQNIADPPNPQGSFRHQFTGQELDVNTGLYNYRARYYDPGLMRFISADTIQPNRDNPQTLNRYSYVLNNPLKFNDPTGHCAVLAGFSGVDCFTLTLQYHNAVVASAVSSFQQGDYLSAAKSSLFSLGTALNVLAGFTLQGIVQPYNSTFMATSGLREGNAEKFIYGSLETALIFGGMKLLNPSPITINTAAVASDAGGILGPSGPGQFILRSEVSTFETATVVRQGEFLNRVFDSRFVFGADVSGPLGRSFALGSGVPTTANEAILQRGLNIFFSNNAQEAIIYRATGNIPGTLRMSIGGTAPEVLIGPSFYSSLEPIVQCPLVP